MWWALFCVFFKDFFLSILVCINVAICNLVHGVETVHGLCQLRL